MFSFVLKVSIKELKEEGAQNRKFKFTAKALLAKVVVVNDLTSDPIEFAVADKSGAIKIVWYMGPAYTREAIRNFLEEGEGVFLANFKVGRNLLILTQTVKVRR